MNYRPLAQPSRLLLADPNGDCGMCPGLAGEGHGIESRSRTQQELIWPEVLLLSSITLQITSKLEEIDLLDG